MKSRVAALIATLGLALTGVFVAATPAQARAQAPASVLVSALARRCLDVDGGATASGSGVSIFSCHRGANQMFTYNDDGTMSIYDGRLCLDTYQRGTEKLSRVVVADCDGSTAQKWTLYTWDIDQGRWYYTLRHQDTNMCLDVYKGRTKNATPVVIHPCHGGSNQVWTFN